MTNTAAFDGVAAAYDAAFTHTPLGQLLRRRVWEVLADRATAGQRVLEMACGTGEDALWLAQRGVRLVATDGSTEMIRIAAAKVEGAGLGDVVDFYHMPLQEIIARRPSHLSHQTGRFDGAFSNFGGLNAIGAWRPLAEVLARLVRPGGWVVLVVMGPFCPWEVVWHLFRGEWETAVRRWRNPAMATVGGATIPVWYPSSRRLRRAFAPWFRPVQRASLGLWLPPSHLGRLVSRWPHLFTWLDRLERATERVTAGWGDHYILALERERIG